MLFNTVQFFAFLVSVLVLHYTLPRSARKYLLLAASYFFYMSWNAVFVFLLLTLTVTDYIFARLMERVTDARRRKLFLVLSLAANLGFLGFFKYYNFLAGIAAQVLGVPREAFALSIILPLGISFHTFQSMSYLVDVYRGQFRAIRNPIDYALFIAFFPQLVAGPIVRAHEFFAGLYSWRAPDDEERLRGVLLMLLGLVKKVALADQFAQIADAYFRDPGAQPGMAAAWAGTGSFAMQIFFDFSGYTDMAIGMALLLGFHFPINFRRPYLAYSITDFWRRWHMSLSRWLRDYLYIPLGGNRGGRWETYRNLMLTMLLGGLWHGASWNFVIWGGYHGALLAVERALGRGRSERRPPLLLYPFRALLTFLLVLTGWVFFRAVTLPDSVYVLGQMFAGPWTGSVDVIPRWLSYLTVASLAIALFEERFQWLERLSRGRSWAATLAYAATAIVLLFCAELFGVVDKTVPFVYFQF
jgi:D-alanyl-lipoteichoic acid acyltransferase DltB (MBOAT superfamily)